MGKVSQATADLRIEFQDETDAQNQTMAVLNRLSGSLFEARDMILRIQEDLQVKLRGKKGAKEYMDRLEKEKAFREAEKLLNKED